MCADNRGVRCATFKAAGSWWGSPLLSPAAGDADFVLQQRDDHFAAGDAARHLPSSLVVVMPLGGVSAREADKFAVMDAGGILVVGIRGTKVFPPSPDDSTVRVRGHVATVKAVTSPATKKKYRMLTWSVPVDGHIVEWNVIDSGRHRTLEQLVAIVDAMNET
ncbi:MAG: hypothetical protein QOJ98_2857 [Acidobacteriota bacterium]|jgi:hypothetical protein|nr:hypothetical protein [Acidobacteriota bacterium]